MFLLLVCFFQIPDEAAILTPESLLRVADRAYHLGPGRSWSIQEEGLDQAVDLVGPRWRDLSLNVVPEVSSSGGSRGEYVVQLESSFPLANLPRLERAVLEAEQNATRRSKAGERLQFILEVQEVYAKAFLAEILLHHIQELYQQALDQEANLEKQVAQGLVSKTEWYAQQALTGEYAYEISEMESLSQSARSSLDRLLGGPIKLVFPQDPEHLPVSPDNPFEPLMDVTHLLPEALISKAQAQTAQREAEMAMALNSPQLSPNLHYRDEPNGDRWLGLGVKLSFSLRPRKDATWRKDRAKADALEARSAWQAASARSELARRAGLFEKHKQQAASFQEQVLEPLKHQAELYQQAAMEGHVTRRFQLQAWSDLHEAEHQYLLLIHGLWQDKAEAMILNSIFSEGATL